MLRSAVRVPRYRLGGDHVGPWPRERHNVGGVGRMPRYRLGVGIGVPPDFGVADAHEYLRDLGEVPAPGPAPAVFPRVAVPQVGQAELGELVLVKVAQGGQLK